MSEGFEAWRREIAAEILAGTVVGAEATFERCWQASRRAAMEECAGLVEPQGKRPRDCTRCYCLKPEDAQAVEAWDTMTNLAAEIRKRIEEGGG